MIKYTNCFRCGKRCIGYLCRNCTAKDYREYIREKNKEEIDMADTESIVKNILGSSTGMAEEKVKKILGKKKDTKMHEMKESKMEEKKEHMMGGY